MATWEDGPEYAPLERPVEFTSPPVGPSDGAPTSPEPPRAAAAPVERPAFAGPAQPVAALETLVPAPADPRDPALPFEVVASSLTPGSAWGSAHGSPGALTPVQPPAPEPWPPVAPPQPAAAYGPLAPALPPPPSPAWPPVPPQPGTSYPPLAPGAFPAPGTPQWFTPPPTVSGGQPAPGRPDLRRLLEAATPGLLITLGVGALLGVLAPVLLVVAFVLADRVQAGRTEVRRALGIALGAVGFFALVGMARLPLSFGEWWGFLDGWAQFTSLVLLVTVPLLVHRALRRGPTPPPSLYPNPWR